MSGGFPKLRPVERVPGEDNGQIMLRDPTGIADGILTLSPATLFIAAMMDGVHAPEEIQARFTMRFGQMLFSDELERLIGQLDEAGFLESPAFAARRTKLIETYRKASVRPLRDAASLSGGGQSLDLFIDGMMADSPAGRDRIVGLVAPHLDYPRGAACYGRAYRDLSRRTDARRFVILGTNHFGETAAVVGTRKDFETPWGVVRHDGEFMAELDRRCGVDLCEGEIDHAREHSIELQVVLLRRVLGDREFTIVPFLCPDPCGSSGTRPRRGVGVDLRVFAEQLGELIAADSIPTCVIAGADLSHIGAYFNDSNPLSEASLGAVRRSDLAALKHVEAGEPEAFWKAVAATGNETNICSVGCIYAAAVALSGRGRPVMRHYHQALTAEIANCVTCAAMDFVAN